MSSISAPVQTISISVSLLAAGAMATLSLFDIPELQAQPASRSLPSIRWLFSRGSHIFPQAAVIASSGFAYLAYTALPPEPTVLAQVMSFHPVGATARGYLSAAALVASILPFTGLMIPTNFAIMKMNEEKGGVRSQKSAQKNDNTTGQRSALDSVKGDGEAEEFTDLSGPQTQTSKETTRDEDEQVRKLLTKFKTLHSTRTLLIGAGGIVGLWTSLNG